MRERHERETRERSKREEQVRGSKVWRRRRREGGGRERGEEREERVCCRNEKMNGCMEGRGSVKEHVYEREGERSEKPKRSTTGKIRLENAQKGAARIGENTQIVAGNEGRNK